MSTKSEEWKVDDGAVDKECYESQKIKILWVLRETNGSDFDFNSFLRDPSVYNLWKRTVGLVVKTSHAIFNKNKTDGDYEYPTDEKKVMKRIAWINVKKTGGGSSSDHKKIHNHATMNSKNIEDQIKELSPDIIILAGTQEYVSDRVKKNISSLTGKNTL